MLRTKLQEWINLEDNARHARLFGSKLPAEFERIKGRTADFYISLVGELFEKINTSELTQHDWAQVGNAFLQISTEYSDEQLVDLGIARDDVLLFAASAFYFGDYPASANLTLRRTRAPDDEKSLRTACHDFLARPVTMRSVSASQLKELILTGSLSQLAAIRSELQLKAELALGEGPVQWMETKLFNRILENFNQSNLRSVLPNGESKFWDLLVQSFVRRRPSTMEFFPSQIQAIQNGFLTSDRTFSLQMPTGAGKTTLCETLLYQHLKSRPGEAAIMLVPYRSLASELRGTLVQNLNSVGLASMCSYGGTVPTSEELHELDLVRAVIATPESLLGLLGADTNLAQRIGLVICDEGHLLDSDSRGIVLELLLSRLKARRDRECRFVFISAIVPNIEEINAWLGGNETTVIRSDYKPAIAEFAFLRTVGSGVNTIVNLEMHPHEVKARQFTVEAFLTKKDFSIQNAQTNRTKTLDFSSKKVRVIAAARKVLPLGSTAIFSMSKGGKSGAIGIAEGLVAQLQHDLELPRPIDFANRARLAVVLDYVADEFGDIWIGTVALRNGAVLHHGDIPQETRETLERLIRQRDIQLIICTQTLAEGVNLPIRTLLLYSIERTGADKQTVRMRARDIKNLVGRAGRAGANTKGLVICSTPEVWKQVEPIALLGAGESVRGSLTSLIRELTNYLVQSKLSLTNEYLEQLPIFYPLVDGIDAALLEMLSQEVGVEEFVGEAVTLANQTLASAYLAQSEEENLQTIFSLRARRIISYRQEQKLSWAQQTGAKIRLIESIEQTLLPLRSNWSDIEQPLSKETQLQLFSWAWGHSDLQTQLRVCYRLENGQDIEPLREQFFKICSLWIDGVQFKEIAAQCGLSMDTLLRIHATGITYSLQTLMEQGISLLEKRLESEKILLAESVRAFSDNIRFGTPTLMGRALAKVGIRFRKAYVLLGRALLEANIHGTAYEIKSAAKASLNSYPENWQRVLGTYVYESTIKDLS